MATEIRVRFDGNAPRLSEGKISLGAFALAFDELLRALRRIAADIVLEPGGQADRVAEGARRAEDAELLDLAITGISHDGIDLELVPAQVEISRENAALRRDLPSRAGAALLSAIESESRGSPRDRRVRGYLDALPENVTDHEYTLRVDGIERRRVRISTARTFRPTRELAALREFVARPEGVEFAVRVPKIQLREHGHGAAWYDATPEHVEAVLANRAAVVRVLIIEDSCARSRILRLRVGDGALPVVSDDIKRRRLFGDWSGVLRRLS